jgi:RNA polymerase sigma-70 factor (ECF subfamily)
MLSYQQSDPEAAAALIDRLSPQIYRFYVAQVRDSSLAEDLHQEFWLRLHKARRTYRPSEPVLPWAYAIARRVRVDHYRRRRRIAEHEVQREQLPETVSYDPGYKSTHDLADLLRTLPVTQQEAILLLKVSGLSLEEAALATGTSVGAVKQKAHRAYAKLRKLFGPET